MSALFTEHIEQRSELKVNPKLKCLSENLCNLNKPALQAPRRPFPMQLHQQAIIKPFGKIAVTFEPVMQFGCPS